MYTPQKFYEEILVSNPYLKVSEKKYFDEHGKESSFLITGHNRNKTVGTCVLPITKDKRIIYLKEFRYGPEDWIINFPIGMLDDGVDEISNGKRELEEETGFYSDDLDFLSETIIGNYFEGKILYYVAKNCEKIGEQNLESGENIQVYTATFAEFEKMILDGEVKSSETAFCYFLAKTRGYFN
ncbi:NUDIX hydrolase [Candidatus Gracilibacteria bacterium]|nr:MAG: NUDIX hydrolase [Candidatus Gracilibacteria bacterium]